ncbi:MAG: TolC family protein [Gammaproteobacteria bacterium]|nr:TolC family protein [Gammaproteobacteria bacterium]
MLNHFCLLGQKGCRIAMYGLMLFFIAPLSVQAQELWTLENSIQRVIEIAPETRGAEAVVSAREGELKQAGVWPNPQIELRADDAMSKDEGRSGTDFTQFAFSQPLPLGGRLGHQRSAAEAQLDAARSQRRYQQVRLETQVAQRYHNLQLAAERLRLAELRLQLANTLQDAGRQREQAGELSRLERLRLDLIRETAQQILDRSEGEANEALSRFRAYLGLASGATETRLQLTPLEPFNAMPALAQLQVGLSQHPALLAVRQQLEAAQAEVRLVRAERIPDPTLSLFRERDSLNGRRQNVNGIGVGFTLPLWNRSSGRISAARAQVARIQSELQVLERDLGSRLQQSYLHLGHLVQQGKHYRNRVFKPAQQVFDLTRKAYANGEMEILSLIDANNTYFDARERYLELLQEAWQEAAELRLASGRRFVDEKQVQGRAEEKINVQAIAAQDTHHE